MTLDDENFLLPFALTAAVKAARVIMDIYKDSDFDVVEKPDHTPVTRADMASNAVIVETLRKSDRPILSEESAHESYETRQHHSEMWVVDPLDGTKEFIKRNDKFSVCIALVENHKPALGVIILPAQSLIYFTHGGVAWRAEVGKDGFLRKEARLPVRFGPLPHVVLGSVSHPSGATTRVVESLKGVDGWANASLVGVGSSIKQCMIAEGAAALYPRSGTTMEWDTAAGQALIEAAGGRLVRVSDGQPMDYNRPELRNPDFLAVAPGLEEDVVQAAMTAMSEGNG